MMDFTTLQNCLSYDSSSNYFLWSSGVDSLKIFVSEILKDTAIASADVNEDKHHKMFSFKAADCTIKLYTSTKKVIIQGSGSANLTKIFSANLNNKRDAVERNNDRDEQESSSSTSNDCFVISPNLVNVSNTVNQDDVISELHMIRIEMKKMKDDISNILSNGGKIKSSSESVVDVENLNFKLREENNLLRNHLKVTEDHLADMKKVIDTLECEKSTLISTINILQNNQTTKLTQDELFESTSVLEVNTPAESESVMQQKIPVNKPKKIEKNSVTVDEKRKKNKKNRKHKQKSSTTKVTNTQSNSSASRQLEQEEKRVVILGDSVVKGLQWWKMSKNNVRVQVKCFPGATVSDMECYAIPTLRSDPDEIIVHIGTNDLRHRSSQDVAEDIINLCDDLSQNTTARITISGLTTRTDDSSIGEKVKDTNRILKSFVSCRDLKFIDNCRIGSNMLNGSGLHLNQKGSAALAKNILNQVVNSH